MPGWVVGIVAWMLFGVLGEYKCGGKLSFRWRFCWQKPLTHFAEKAQMRSVSKSLNTFMRVTLPRLLGAAVVIW